MSIDSLCTAIDRRLPFLHNLSTRETWSLLSTLQLPTRLKCDPLAKAVDSRAATLKYIDKLYFSILKKKRENVQSQVTKDVIAHLENYGIHVLKLPLNTTDRIQPMDLSVNKSITEFLLRNLVIGILLRYMSSYWDMMMMK